MSFECVAETARDISRQTVLYTRGLLYRGVIHDQTTHRASETCPVAEEARFSNLRFRQIKRRKAGCSAESQDKEKRTRCNREKSPYRRCVGVEVRSLQTKSCTRRLGAIFRQTLHP